MAAREDLLRLRSELEPTRDGEPGSDLFPGMVACGLLTFAMTAVCLVGMYAAAFLFERSILWKPGMGTTAFVLLCAEIASFASIIRYAGSGGGGVLRLAEFKRWPAWLRPIVLAWWGVHFAILFLIEGDVATLRLTSDTTQNIEAATWILRYVAEIGVTFALNVYLMLLIGALSRRGILLHWAHRHRWLITATLAGLGLFMPIGTRSLLAYLQK